MGDLIPIIEGPVKFREGKKWKSRFASAIRLSPVADSLTLQLWKDRKDWERNPPSKGSIALEEYIGWEAGFTLDRESNTLALILKADIISLAFDNRETLMRWQVRMTSQFEEGQHFSAHLLQVPAGGKGPKLSPCAVKVHVQNRRFSLTCGVPPRLVHSWNLHDLRRFGALDNGRFCFEGGSRCGKGEGMHLLRLDDPRDLQKAFEAASASALESKRKSMYKSSNHGSFSSHLDSIGVVSSAHSVLSMGSTLTQDQPMRSRSRLTYCHAADSSDLSSGAESTTALIHSSAKKRSLSRDELKMSSSSRSRCRTPSNWSSNESSIETMSLAISELTDGLHQLESQHQILHSPDHLVNRKDLLEKMGIHPGVTTNNKATANGRHLRSVASGEFSPNWSMDLANNKAEDSFTYDIPKAALPVKTNHDPPPLTPKKATSRNKGLKRMVVASPCACEGQAQSYENYDIPKHITQEALQFYDTPRNLATSEPSLAFENYDTPQQPLPVYTKPCGCIMKLVYQNGASNGSEEESKMVWACVQQSPELVNQLSADAMPRVKLTGTGKMPVVDMRAKNSTVVVAGLPPKSPVYAAVNKTKKASLTSSAKKLATAAAHQHNYCNVSPLLGDVISKPADLFTSVKPNQIFACMDSQLMQQLEPVKPPLYENTKQVLSRLKQRNFDDDDDEPVDSISLRLRELHDALDNEESETFADLIHPGDFNLSDLGEDLLPPPPPELLAEANGAKYLSGDNLPALLISDDPNARHSGLNATMPRSKNQGSGQVIMRRSSSVPCKASGGQSDRGSTSSSDSGFSAGSPGHSIK